MFMPFTLTQGMMVHFLTVSLILWLWYNQLLMIRRSLSFLVMPMQITLRGWSRSLLLIGMGVMLLIFEIYLVLSSLCAVPLTLLVTDSILWWLISLTIVDVFVGTTLGISDHCYVSFLLSFEQSVPEYNVRSTVFHSIIPTGTVSVVQSGALHEAPFWRQLIH